MHALSAYNCEAQSVISPALCALEDRVQGLTTGTCIAEKGCFAEFQWPDWPPRLSTDLAKCVESFHKLRGVADYGAESATSVSRQQAQDKLRNAREFVAMAEQFLKGAGGKIEQ
jgi:hypothetical protein